jgi:apolipoprotein N-acyltransferase
MRVTTAIACLIAGGVHTLGFAPSGLWVLQLLGMAALAAQLSLIQAGQTRARAREGFWIGMWFGLGWFLAGVYWVYISMHDIGGMPAPIAAIATFLLAALLALFPATASAAYAALLPGLRWWQASLLFASVLALADWLRGWVLTGLPWVAAGYAHTDSPLAALAPLGGVYAVGFGAALVASLLAGFVNRAVPGALRLQALIALAVTAAALFGAGSLEFGKAQGPAVTVRLMQGGIPQDLKFNPERTLAAQNLYTTWIEQSKAQFNVTPETAWANFWDPNETAQAKRLMAAVASSKSAVALGVPLVQVTNGKREPTNSVVLLGGTSITQPTYTKRHLVPFGEYIPPMFGWFVQLMNIPLGTFGIGPEHQPVFEVGQARLAFNICYEDLFGADLLAPIREQSASVLVNVSNLAWFGQSWAMPQHLQIARMRALETARPMLRATNTGVTAHIDHQGKVVAQLPLDAPGVLDISVQPTQGQTPYVRFGNWPVACFSGLILLATAWRRRSR